MVFAIRNTSFEQRASAQSCGLDIVFHRSGQPPLRVDHEELALVRATLDAVEDSGRGTPRHQRRGGAAAVGLFRRYAMARQLTSEADRAAAEREGRDLVFHDDEGHVVATVSHEEVAGMRESRRLLRGVAPERGTTH